MNERGYYANNTEKDAVSGGSDRACGLLEADCF
jgi:hypothetical protein